MQDAFNALIDSLLSLFAFIVIIFLIVSVTSSSTDSYNTVAGFISTKASSLLTSPHGQATLYISPGDALFDAINSPNGVTIIINGMLIDSELSDGAREHDTYSLAILGNIFKSSTWKEVTVIDNSGQLTALEFWKGD